MRLNFSGVSEAEIHEGIRRIGEIVHEQVGLYGTLTGAAPASRADADPAGRTADAEPSAALAKVLRLPAQRKRAG
jgi:2-aminoadipate transaminase